MIVGTAGHIDHGKTSLVKAITGTDTDRLKEEKARGITIELGFAYWPRPTVTGAVGQQATDVIGFVDVPGHERLVHTMLAGATGIDFVLLVVAADDGVMPQTREHLAIIDLLGLRRGLIAMTKCDLADGARREQVAAEVRALVAGTGLADAEILPVSTVTGEGLGELASRLDAAAATTTGRAADGLYRQAVDRVFSLAGAGTVVTGTVLTGKVRVGDHVVVSPRGLAARVRSIHAQGRAAAQALAGDRAAIALVGAGIAIDAIHRGDVVLDAQLHNPVRRFDARLTLLAGERRPLREWMPVHLHHAAAAIPARVAVLSVTPLAPGGTEFAHIVLESPLAAAVGDRIILRDSAATRTIAGGTIVDLAPPQRHRRSPERRAELTALDAGEPATALKGHLSGTRGFVYLDAFCRDRAMARTAADAAAGELGATVLEEIAGRPCMLREVLARYVDGLLGRLSAYHAERPDEPGLGQERLRLALAPRLPAPVFAGILSMLQNRSDVRLDRAWVRLPDHEVRFSPEEEAIWARIRPLLGAEARFRPPRVRDVAKLQSIDEGFVRRLFRLAARRGEVDEIARDHFFLATTVTELADVARGLAAAGESGRFSVVQFRDRLDNGRKVAIQILEYFDAQGLTMRRGDLRRINPHKADLFRTPAVRSKDAAA